MDYQKWLKDLEGVLRQTRPDVRVMDIDPNVMFQAFQDGESPVLFARRNPIPLRPATQPPVQARPPVAPPPQFQRPGHYVPPQSSAPKSNPAPWMLIVGGILVLPMFICCAGIFNGAFNSGNQSPKQESEVRQEPVKPNVAPTTPSTSPSTTNETARADDMSEYRQRFETVAEAFRQQGARVDALDPSFPYTMRIYLPSRVAMDMTDGQARELAGLTRTRLHENAIVYLKSEGGQTLAKASPWGVEGRQ